MTKTCEDCGTEFDALRKNAKYCRVCRLLRNVLYLDGRTCECLICEKTYAPLEPPKLQVCRECNPNGSKHDVAGTCVFCGTESTRLLHKDVKVCSSCAESPDQRELFVKALGKKKASRCPA